MPRSSPCYLTIGPVRKEPFFTRRLPLSLSHSQQAAQSNPKGGLRRHLYLEDFEIMPARIFAAIGGLALLATAVSAGDGTDDNDNKTILFDNGHWRTEMYAQNAKGMPMCVMIVYRKFGDRSFGQVAMKSNAAGDLFIHISKSNWRMAANRKVPIYVSFDRDRREVMGRTVKGTNGDTIVEISVNPKIAANILESFAKAGQLTIEFREGDEQPWVDRMIDSRKAMKAFNSCLEKISPTQPAAPVSSKPKPDNHI